MNTEREKFTVANNKFLCRWWLKTRDCKDFPNLIELYVPWWAWPLEIFHRLIFGSTKIK